MLRYVTYGNNILFPLRFRLISGPKLRITLKTSSEAFLACVSMVTSCGDLKCSCYLLASLAKDATGDLECGMRHKEAHNTSIVF